MGLLEPCFLFEPESHKVLHNGEITKSGNHLIKHVAVDILLGDLILNKMTWAASFGVVCISFGATLAHSQAPVYPDRPVTLIVGYAPGGATDRVARMVGKVLADQTKQTFIVENKAGANSNVGAEMVARAKPDGYTLYIGSIANTINHSLYNKLNFDLNKDFKQVALLALVPNMLVVNPNLPINSVKQYIAYAKANPGKLTCASSGSGSSIHLSCELFKIDTGTNILHIPYKGSGPAVADLLGGQVDSMFDNLPSSIGQVRAGKLRALGVTTATRVPFAPEIPTLIEQGIPGFAVTSWFGVMAPAGTPQVILDKLNAEINKALNTTEVKASYFAAGFISPPAPNSQRQYGDFVTSEIDRWNKVISAGNIKVD
jgi:tripartite-type tricarboxylate transporter receptor subunit TctC